MQAKTYIDIHFRHVGRTLIKNAIKVIQRLRNIILASLEDIEEEEEGLGYGRVLINIRNRP